MQLAPFAAVTATPSASALHNLAVLTTSELDARGDFTVDTTTVPFTNETGATGFHMLSTYVGNGILVKAQRYMPSARETAARAALADAIAGSGLLQQMTASTGNGKADLGMTRIFVDNRSRVIEFSNTAVPAAAQAVLDALAAYRAIAAKNA